MTEQTKENLCINTVIANSSKSPFNNILTIKTKDELFENILNLYESKNLENKNNLHRSEIPTDQSNYDDKKSYIYSTRIIANTVIVPINNVKDEEIKMVEIKQEEKPEKMPKFGRKKARSGIEGKHNKFSDDNLRRKCKHIILNEILMFINDKINEIYDGDLGQGILIKKLYTLNHNQKANAVIKYNKEFLYKTLGDIFSENISSRYTNFPKEHNKYLIEKLRQEKDDAKRIYFNNLFNLTFLQSLKHFIGREDVVELDGLKTLDEIMKQFDYDSEYKSCLDYYLRNFDIIINNKKSRKSRKSESDKEEEEDE